jgi:hypothetical protein
MTAPPDNSINMRIALLTRRREVGPCSGMTAIRLGKSARSPAPPILLSTTCGGSADLNPCQDDPVDINWTPLYRDTSKGDAR